MNNVFWFSYLNVIGGTETFLYNIVKKYCDKDITIYYKNGDIRQVSRLSKFVKVRQWKQNEKIICDKFFCNWDTGIIEYVKANEYIQIIHADYKALGVKPNTHPKITKYIGVSKQVCDSFEELTKIKPELCYNPIVVEKPKKVLNLVSATRLTREKGKDRMLKLANALTFANIPFNWIVYTNDTIKLNHPDIVYKSPRLDIIDYIADADYLVQLSDSEAYCYSVVEALSVKTPVIVTNCPVYEELGIKDRIHGFILDFNMENIPVDEIYSGLPKFKYTVLKDSWNKLLKPGNSVYDPNIENINTVKVQCVQKYYDMKLNKVIHVGNILEMDVQRASYLIDIKYVVLCKK